MQASSAISFRLPPTSFSADASTGSPLPSTFVSGFSGLNFFPLSLLSVDFLTPAVFAPFRSLQFWVLTTQPLFLPFLLFPVPPHSCFPGARLRSRFLGFPVLSCLISHAFLPGSCTRLRCLFPFALPCFAPTAVPQVLAFRFRFLHFPVFFRFLSSASVPFRLLGFLFLPFPASCLRLSGASSVLRLFLSVLPFSAFSSAWFPMLLFRLSVLGFLLVSFRPSQFRSRSRYPGAYLLLSLSVFVLLFRFLSSASFLGLNYSASALSFPFFPFSPGSGSFGAYFPLPFRLFPCFPSGSGTQLSVLLFSSFVSPRSGYFFTPACLSV